MLKDDRKLQAKIQRRQIRLWLNICKLTNLKWNLAKNTALCVLECRILEQHAIWFRKLPLLMVELLWRLRNSNFKLLITNGISGILKWKLQRIFRENVIMRMLFLHLMCKNFMLKERARCLYTSTNLGYFFKYHINFI